MTKMPRRLVFGLLLAGALPALGQSYKTMVDEGNDLYRSKQYEKAGKKFDAAIEEEPTRVEGYFNRGNTAYRSDDPAKAIGSYTKAGEFARSKEEGARLWYNGGNTLMKAGDYAKAVEAYKQSLKLDPGDEDARYNLLYAMQKLAQQQQQQQQKQDQKQDKNKEQQKQDQNQDKNKDQEQKQDQQKEQDKRQDKQDQQQQKRPQQQDPKRMSKQQAEQILKALERDEKDLQKKLKERRASRVRIEKDW